MIMNDIRSRVRAWVRAWRTKRQLSRYQRFIAKAARADRIHTLLLTGTPTPNLSRGKELVLFATAPRPDFTPMARACQAVLERMVPRGLSVRRLTGRSVGRRRLVTATAREAAPPRSTARRFAAHIAHIDNLVLGAPPKRTPPPRPRVDPMTDSMAGRITYAHAEADSPDMGLWLAALHGEPVAVAPVVPIADRRPGRHTSHRQTQARRSMAMAA